MKNKNMQVLSFNVVNKKGQNIPMQIGISNKILAMIGRSVIEERKKIQEKTT
jgi:hypothetical protein